MLDLRLPIGYFFIINSILLIVCGFFFPVQTLYSGGAVNLDLTWGSLMGLFGLVMTALGLADRLKQKEDPKTGDNS